MKYLPIVIVALLGLLFYQNIILSKKLAVIYKDLGNIEFYLRDGVCE